MIQICHPHLVLFGMLCACCKARCASLCSNDLTDRSSITAGKGHTLEASGFMQCSLQHQTRASRMLSRYQPPLPLHHHKDTRLNQQMYNVGRFDWCYDNHCHAWGPCFETLLILCYSRFTSNYCMDQNLSISRHRWTRRNYSATSFLELFCELLLHGVGFIKSEPAKCKCPWHQGRGAFLLSFMGRMFA